VYTRFFCQPQATTLAFHDHARLNVTRVLSNSICAEQLWFAPFVVFELSVVLLQAHPRRVAKVSSQIQREISEMFIYDKVTAAAAAAAVTRLKAM
jgi:hypothetical protein